MSAAQNVHAQQQLEGLIYPVVAIDPRPATLAAPLTGRPTLLGRWRTMAAVGVKLMFHDRLKLAGTLFGVVFSVVLARAGVLAAEAKVAQAQATLDRLAVRAPTDGEVLQVKVREGELYSFMGMEVEPLVVLGDTRTLRVRMDVDERDIARVRLGAKAWVTADAFGSRRFPGKVVEIGRRFGRKNIQTDDPIEKNDTKILEVLLELEEQGSLVPGQRVTSYIVTTPPPQS